MSGARGDVMGVMDKLACHLAQVVGSWCGRLAGQEEERAGRGGCAWAGAARRAVADADGPTTRARAHQGGHPGARASEAVRGGGGQCAL